MLCTAWLRERPFGYWSRRLCFRLVEQVTLLLGLSRCWTYRPSDHPSGRPPDFAHSRFNSPDIGSTQSSSIICALQVHRVDCHRQRHAACSANTSITGPAFHGRVVCRTRKHRILSNNCIGDRRIGHECTGRGFNYRCSHAALEHRKWASHLVLPVYDADWSFDTVLAGYSFHRRDDLQRTIAIGRNRDLNPGIIAFDTPSRCLNIAHTDEPSSFARQ